MENEERKMKAMDVFSIIYHFPFSILH